MFSKSRWKLCNCRLCAGPNLSYQAPEIMGTNILRQFKHPKNDFKSNGSRFHIDWNLEPVNSVVWRNFGLHCDFSKLFLVGFPQHLPKTLRSHVTTLIYCSHVVSCWFSFVLAVVLSASFNGIILFFKLIFLSNPIDMAPQIRACRTQLPWMHILVIISTVVSLQKKLCFEDLTCVFVGAFL